MNGTHHASTPLMEIRNMPTEPVELLRRFVDSYNDRSLPDEAKGIFAPDLVVVNKSAGLETEGIDSYLAHAYHGWIRAVPDAHIELVDYQVGDRTVSCTLVSGGTFDGTMETAEGSIPGTGKSFEIELRVDADIADGAITRWESRYDMEDWQQQVGLAGAA